MNWSYRICSHSVPCHAAATIRYIPSAVLLLTEVNSIGNIPLNNVWWTPAGGQALSLALESPVKWAKCCRRGACTPVCFPVHVLVNTGSWRPGCVPEKHSSVSLSFSLDSMLMTGWPRTIWHTFYTLIWCRIHVEAMCVKQNHLSKCSPPFSCLLHPHLYLRHKDGSDKMTRCSFFSFFFFSFECLPCVSYYPKNLYRLSNPHNNLRGEVCDCFHLSKRKEKLEEVNGPLISSANPPLLSSRPVSGQFPLHIPCQCTQHWHSKRKID